METDRHSLLRSRSFSKPNIPCCIFMLIKSRAFTHLLIVSHASTAANSTHQ